MNITEDNMDKIGELSDRIENLTYAAKLNLPPAMHLEQITKVIVEIKDELRAIYKDTTGENPWE